MKAQKCLIASLASTIALVIHAAPTLAASFYSVDTRTDQLVAINSNSGNVRVIGNVGFHASDLDLAFLGDTLYGVAGSYLGNWALYEFNTITGAASLVANLPTSVRLAEGLTSQNGNLIVGFNTTGSVWSDTLAELSLSGALANITAFSSASVYPADTDGLTTSPTNQLYAVDYQPDRTNFSFTPGSTVPFGGYVSPNGLNDLAFVGNELFGISNSSPVLAIVNSADGGVIQELTLDRPGTYLGLASSAAVPEPSTMLGSLAIVALATRLKRRKAKAN
ncbi:MAG: PEP-CTERM sorting domain-containing protein [Leptolyngbyaceae cyanobacterium bins.302]|nr:PEP-CTERM sorting domain-containing protein [Leptolyngbyaceae cyanobacterium bins.302]